MKNPKIQWHPAFCSAVRLELRENRGDLQYANEYNLNRKPIQIDLLVVTKSDDILIDNEIGKIFRRYNIMEYKSPEDEMNIDTYFKTLAYACLYKAGGVTVDAIRCEEVTISLVRAAKPIKLLKWFETNGYNITNPYLGIYYIKKEGFFDTQIIVSKELRSESHIWLSSLQNNIEPQETIELLESYEDITTKAEREYADAVVEVVLEANPEAERKVKEESAMASELWETFKAEREKAERLGWEVGLREGREKGMREGREKGMREGREKGMREGRKTGLQEGLQEGRLEVVVSMLRQGRLTLKEAASEAKVSQEKLKEFLRDK
ncbi:MAG: hypothetical protein HDR05_03170 [Lachnospiraceae bacterium]|nr:hypothetical protein [Lachnospiraceae bacterium]